MTRIGPGHPDPIRPARSDPARETSWVFVLIKGTRNEKQDSACVLSPRCGENQLRKTSEGWASVLYCVLYGTRINAS